MPTSFKLKAAQRLYDAGLALYQENRYAQALTELKKAEDSFRKIDSRGHPFMRFLPNGVSGIANSLALSGLCHYRLGDFRNAVTCFEASLINSKFEKKDPFREFLSSFTPDAAACYEKLLERLPPETISRILANDPEIDTAFRFPFSLSPDSIPIARLYELSPQRNDHYKDFYLRARTVDADLRRKQKQTDETTMKMMGLYVWGALLAIFSVYGMVVINVLFLQK